MKKARATTLILFLQNQNISERYSRNMTNNDANVSAPKLIPKSITGLSSSTVYRHYQSLREKGTLSRKWEMEEQSILSPDSISLF